MAIRGFTHVGFEEEGLCEKVETRRDFGD